MKLGIATCAVVALTLVGAHCGKTGLSEDDERKVRDYQVEQLLCVDKAKTLEESQACRCEVKAKYGRPCELPRRDGGL